MGRGRGRRRQTNKQLSPTHSSAHVRRQSPFSSPAIRGIREGGGGKIERDNIGRSVGGAVSMGANYFDFSSNNALPKSPFENCVSKGIQNVVSLQRPNFTLENRKVGHFGNLFRDCGYFCPSERLSRPAINWELMSSSMAAKCIASRVLGFEKASKRFPITHHASPKTAVSALMMGVQHGLFYTSMSAEQKSL